MLLFEWDEEKARSNLAKHGVSFEDAAGAFHDPLLIELEPSVADGEVRYSIIGTTKGVVLHVAYTERAEIIRVISARKATRHERIRYEEV